MEVQHTPLQGCFVLKPKVFQDERGYFYESFNKKLFNEIAGQDITFVQDNQSYSTKGVLRGLHLQKGEHAQAKLVRVLKGEVLDVAVDLRPESPTYGKYFEVILSDENHLQLFIPKGFAHGFVVLSDEAIFTYKCDNYYNKSAEGGLNSADPSLNIDWRLPLDELIINEKDRLLPGLDEVNALHTF